MSDWQLREMARFDADGPDMHYAGPREERQYCDECRGEIGWNDVAKLTPDHRTLCISCWVSETDPD